MNLSQMLRKDLTRLFKGANPLDYIQDIRVEETPEETRCVASFKVPQVPPYFDARADVYGLYPPQDALRRMTDEAILAATLGEFNWRGAQKAPDPKPKEKKLDPMEMVDFLKPKKIIYSGNRTIAFWPDGTKTIVRLMEGQEHDEYSAYCACVVKKMFGATHKAKKFLESVAVRPEPKPEKVKEEPIQEEVCETEVHRLGQEEPVVVPHPDLIPMPGTEDPDWGRKFWCPDAPVPTPAQEEVEENAD